MTSYAEQQASAAESGLDRSRRILVTGASGFIGRQLCPFLISRGFELRTFDRCSAGIVEDSVEGELEDLETLQRPASGVDTMVHLAACADDADFVTNLVPANVVGLFCAFEAARLEGVRRFILASSCQAADLVGRSERITVDDRYPTNHYGLTKLWAEDMGRLYSRRHGLSVLAVRLGWVIRDAEEFAEMKRTAAGRSLFLSHRDLKRFFACCLDAAAPDFATIYAFSRQAEGDIFDMGPSKQIVNFEPTDVFPDGLDPHTIAAGGRTN